MSSSLNHKCCHCAGLFEQTNFPRLVPSCDHSICTNCLKSLFKNENKIIVCTICGNQESITEPDLEYFPKNIALIKQLKDSTMKKPSSITQLQTPTKTSQNGNTIQSNTSISSSKKSGSMDSSDFVGNDSSLISQKSNISQQNDKKFICPTHNKQTQIICLRDFTRLCPLCAVFGAHKDHELKTIDETACILSETLKEFEQVKAKKKSLESYIKNSEFKGKITQKINLARTRLAKEIRERFSAIKQGVQTAQKNANDDLSKRFKQVNDKINRMVKEQSEFESFFSNWARTIELELVQTHRIGITFEQKAQIIFNGTIKSMQEGQFYLAHLESYTHEKKGRLEDIPNQVTINVADNLVKDIYNYLSVKFEDCSPIGYEDHLLTASRVEGPGHDAKSPIVQDNHYMSQTYSVSGKSGSNSQISSANSINQNLNNIMTKKPIKVEFSSSQNFLSPNAKDRLQSPSSGIPPRKSPRQKSKSLPKPQVTSGTNLIKSHLSPQKKQQTPNPKTLQISEQRKRYLSSNSEGIVELFMADDKLDTLDLCAFDMPDNEILQCLDYVHSKKKVKCLKLSQNKLTNDGFTQIIAYLKFTTNLNLSSNLLTEEVLNTLIRQREKVPNLRILNLAHNKVNERKAKVYVDELKKQGIIVTLT